MVDVRSWLVVAGPSCGDLARSFAERISAELVGVDVKLFPDGESRLRIEGVVRDRPVILVQSTYPPVDRHLMQLLLLAHRLSEEGGEVYAVIPYLAYARQDKEFLKGEVVSLAVFSHLLRSVGVKRMVTVDIHSVLGLGYFSIPAFSVSAIPLIAEYFKSHFKLKDPIAASPDFGGSTRVEAFAKIMGLEHVVLKKFRDRVTGEIVMEEAPSNVEERDVLIIDDIISTGGSVQKAAAFLKKAGAQRVFAGCTHPVLVEGALKKMKEAGVDKCLGSNTIPSPISKIDITPLLASYFSAL